MKRRSSVMLAVVAGLSMCSMVGVTQGRGAWRAVSKTARAITGDVSFSNEKISIDFFQFTIAEIRELKPVELAAAFNAGDNAAGSGKLYRLSIPAAKTFLRKNTMCGGEDTQWMATYVSGKNLQLAFFSGAKMPVLSGEALATSTDLCGTYLYAR